MSGEVSLGAVFRHGAERVGEAACRTLVIGCKGHPYVAVVEDGVVGPVGLLDLMERLGNEECAHAIAGKEGQCGFEKLEPAQGGELVQHEQQAALAHTSMVCRLQLLG